VPVTGRLTRGLEHGDRVGAEVVQIFVSNPRGWATSAGDPKQDAAFRDGCQRRGWPLFVHAPYLVNLASPTPATQTRSVAALAHSLRRGADLGAAGVVVHAGSWVTGGYEQALGQLRELLLPLLDQIGDAGPRLLVEPTAGGGSAMAARVEQLEQYFAALDGHPKLGVCLDTCHAWAAGHDLAAANGLSRTVRALTQAVGRGRLALIHANDSRDPRGSTRDRHETLGKGTLGEAAFAQLFTVPALAGVPILVETPIESHDTDIALLKRLRDR
jgi:deoxyribonuclease-4